MKAKFNIKNINKSLKSIFRKLKSNFLVFIKRTKIFFNKIFNSIKKYWYKFIIVFYYLKNKIGFLNKYKIKNVNNVDIEENKIIKIKNLSINFKVKNGIFHAIRNLDIEIERGKIVGVVGESGSGKSVTVKSFVGFNHKAIMTADLLDFDNLNILSVKKNDWKYIRGSKIAYIPQDPLLSLNPTKKIKYQISEAIKITKKRKFQKQLIDIHNDEKIQNKNELIKKIFLEYKEAISRKNVSEKINEVLNFIGIKNIKDRINSYPHEFSGGMRQRIVIAIAIVSEPDLIIADEPTTALDVTIQAKVLDLIKKLRDELKITIIFISHNIALVANFCDFIYVMYAGKIVEQGFTYELFSNPRHPYTWGLICSIPDSKSNQELQSIPGTPPNLLVPPIGDAFAPRNKYAIEIDFHKQPPLFSITSSHKASTWLLHPDSPYKDIPIEVLEKINLSSESILIKTNHDNFPKSIKEKLMNQLKENKKRLIDFNENSKLIENSKDIKKIKIIKKNNSKTEESKKNN